MDYVTTAGLKRACADSETPTSFPRTNKENVRLALHKEVNLASVNQNESFFPSYFSKHLSLNKNCKTIKQRSTKIPFWVGELFFSKFSEY